jgi:hypothetical protein
MACPQRPSATHANDRLHEPCLSVRRAAKVEHVQRECRVPSLTGISCSKRHGRAILVAVALGNDLTTPRTLADAFGFGSNRFAQTAMRDRAFPFQYFSRATALSPDQSRRVRELIETNRCPFWHKTGKRQR